MLSSPLWPPNRKKWNCTRAAFGARRYPKGDEAPAEFGSVGRGVPELGRVEIPEKGDTKAHERDTANASGWESQGKNRVRVHPPPFGGPQVPRRNGGLVLLGARPRNEYPRVSLL
ncbi:hypothetical protein CRENBAI_011599 [Crenichthys baileyi]|uniref:Uncharacterized protein n=1 Tax=Crenichthys baileyi TaxID=28760 RepID=A0AAV9S7I5_9TELE